MTKPELEPTQDIQSEIEKEKTGVVIEFPTEEDPQQYQRRGSDTTTSSLTTPPTVAPLSQQSTPPRASVEGAQAISAAYSQCLRIDGLKEAAKEEIIQHCKLISDIFRSSHGTGQRERRVFSCSDRNY